MAQSDLLVLAQAVHVDVAVGLLRQAGLKATVLQHPLITLEAGVEATRRAIAVQDGPTVLVGHSFAGMIVTEAGMDPKVSSLVYVAARAPDAGEDYAALVRMHGRQATDTGGDCGLWSRRHGERLEDPADATR